MLGEEAMGRRWPISVSGQWVDSATGGRSIDIDAGVQSSLSIGAFWDLCRSRSFFRSSSIGLGAWRRADCREESRSIRIGCWWIRAKGQYRIRNGGWSYRRKRLGVRKIERILEVLGYPHAVLGDGAPGG
jgi:hypothetical protein